MEQKQETPIIGTHNSMTYLRPQKWYGWFMIPFARCQRKTIEEQWHDGARCFDLRVKFDRNGNSHFAHGLYDCSDYFTLTDAINTIEQLRYYSKEDVYVRLILEDTKAENYQAEYFRRACESTEKVYKFIHFFGGNRKGDWAQIVEFDYKPDLTQYVGSMMEDARWYEKFMPFAYAWRRNKKNKQNPQGDIAIYDFI